MDISKLNKKISPVRDLHGRISGKPTTNVHSDKLNGRISHYNILLRKLFNTFLIMKSSEPMAQTMGSQDAPVRDRIG